MAKNKPEVCAGAIQHCLESLASFEKILDGAIASIEAFSDKYKEVQQILIQVKDDLGSYKLPKGKQQPRTPLVHPDVDLDPEV